MKVRHFGQTDVGLRRSNNEDAYLADGPLGLYVVCDGVGGRLGGEVASSNAVRLIWEWIRQESGVLRIAAATPTEASLMRVGHVVRGAIQHASYMITAQGLQDPQHEGMSTTVSAFVLVGDHIVFGQVGDSRIYLSRHGVNQQITEDHTLIGFKLKHGLISPSDAETSRERHIITRAVGQHDYVEVDIATMAVQPGDKLLLCSDGLHDYLQSSEELETIMSPPIETGVHRAIEFAKGLGGKDNITALIVEFYS
jgi:protein phosphatase